MNILIVTLHVAPSAQAVALAAGCLKAALPHHLQKQTTLLDIFPGQPHEELCATLLAHNPEVIAFPLYVWNRAQILELSRRLKQERPQVFLFAGGPEAGADSFGVLREGALDGVIRGEGEHPFAELLSNLEANKPLTCSAFVSRAVSSAGPLPPAACSDPAQLVSPWLSGQLELQEGCGVLWEVARGCHFNCAFCYDTKGRSGVCPLPFPRLRQELELFRRKRVSQIWVLDSTFNAPPERGKKLLRLLAEVAPEIHYHIEAKADFLDAETAELLTRLPCSVQIGLQSAQPEVLKPLRRKLDQEQMSRQLQLLTDAGVTFGLDLIYGLPGDNHQGFCNSLDFALNRQPNQVDIFPLAVLPGTELFASQQAFGIAGEMDPPYQLTANRSYPPADLAASRLLAAATDIFYNRGRAVGFFLQLCQAVQQSPAALLQSFADWLIRDRQLPLEQILAAETWWPTAILPLQLQFAADRLKHQQRGNCISIAIDLIHYHYLCAETVLADECCPIELSGKRGNRGKLRWRRNPQLHIHQFNHALADIERHGALPLTKLAGKLKPAREYGIFLRQGGDFIIEALSDEFAEFLLAADGRQDMISFSRNFPAVSRDEVDFAIAQGLLIPANA
ncbi:B12-binding domain-containing radical SAM protein [Pelobacter seleniigenes]|uniref:B12-binding domain-containing radical SAM protein n=1 Tax=Pelobacter seleniigenes TaxID=407188 RepID=UPI00068ADCA4|nr:B12-binding domain-containing radical SAM protein [Pelobacter seleniigenes]